LNVTATMPELVGICCEILLFWVVKTAAGRGAGEDKTGLAEWRRGAWLGTAASGAEAGQQRRPSQPRGTPPKLGREAAEAEGTCFCYGRILQPRSLVENPFRITFDLNKELFMSQACFISLTST
jgi:hypothetical protein